MGVRLPAEYQEVEYLESTGTQYINTAHNPSGALKISMMFQSTKSPGDAFQSLCGVQNGATKEYIRFSAIYTAAQTQVRFSSANGTNDSASNDFNIDLPSNNYINNNILEYMFDFGSGVFRAGEYSNTRRRNKATLNIPLYLLARNNNGEATAFASGKLYSAEITDSGFSAKPIPCYRKSDSKPGMYDLVTNQFFTNAGTGDFIVGPNVIDSISPWLVARRRMLMYKEPELYPVGTHILSMYIGDKDNGQRRKFTPGYGINTSTGEYYATGDGSTYASDVYVPVNPKYIYQKNGNRLNTWCFYDKDKQYISRAPLYNNLNVQTLAKFPNNVRYVRIQAFNFVNQAIEITRIA